MQCGVYNSDVIYEAFHLCLKISLIRTDRTRSHIKRPPKAWWFAEVEEAVSEGRMAFAVAHRSDNDRQAYISASRRTS